ncbi:MAG: DUF721 domain-containing protein [Prevotella sp.]|nr:DUF721 domain-containing protein [Prevotella sp.]
MFRKSVEKLSDVLQRVMRQEGLETPLLQKRIIYSWDEVMGETVARYTGDKFIKNQTLFVKIVNPALRQDLTMMRSDIVRKLNEKVGAYVISELRIF